MSNHIRTRRAMTSTPSPTATPSPTTTPTTDATALAKMDHRPVNPVDPVGPPVPQAQALLTSSVGLLVSARRTHQRPRTMDQMMPSGSITDASGTQLAKKNTWGPCRQLNTTKVTRIDVFADVYVRPENELTESIHATMVEKSQSVLQESTSQLPSDKPIEYVDPFEDVGFHIVTKTLDQTFGRRPGTYCRGMGNARWRESRASLSSQSKGQVTALKQEVAGLRILPHRACTAIRPVDLRPCP
ncbi:hypothetical protein C1H46_020929 [Malus baccata]|uniref:Uncharacterized protein n=1 Tax=Malus baccata TaxID=106549 RepID=A0A540M3Z0_MALBA|nr:hypothetical protein C1H46_020929 [Malus baccata]